MKNGIQIFCKKINIVEDIISSIPITLSTKIAKFPVVIETSEGNIDVSEAIKSGTFALANCLKDVSSMAYVNNFEGLMIGYSVDEDAIYVDSEENLNAMGITEIPEGESGFIATRNPNVFIPFPQKISPEEEAFLRSLGDE